jgi:hypothetical protein
MLTTYSLLDLTPIGRNETHGLAEWVHPHDRYNTAGHVDMSTGEWVSDENPESSDCGCH